jgi:hypothetical protein
MATLMKQMISNMLCSALVALLIVWAYDEFVVQPRIILHDELMRDSVLNEFQNLREAQGSSSGSQQGAEAEIVEAVPR